MFEYFKGPKMVGYKRSITRHSKIIRDFKEDYGENIVLLKTHFVQVKELFKQFDDAECKITTINYFKSNNSEQLR